MTDDYTRPAEQCEDCVFSTYNGDFGICSEYTGGPCDEVNPENDCKYFNDVVVRTRCIKKGDGDEHGR